MNGLALPDLGEVFVKLGFAFALSALVGLEREARHRPAGFRTHVLVCVASCLLMMLSIGLGGARFDPARLAAQVVTGIGFLGAGTIMRHGDIVRGLTTAASIWAVAAVGLAVGAGWFGAALLTALLMVGTLLGLNWMEDRLVPPRIEGTVQASVGDEPEAVGDLVRRIEAIAVQVGSVKVERVASGGRTVSLEITCSGALGPPATADRLLALDGVVSVHCR
jgi:putative Mg2+ transporter-C (MgtC) family protein